MGLHYTKKRDETDEKTVPTADFIDLMLESRRMPDKRRKEDKIESNE